MPKIKSEDDKKHGDPLEPLIDRTGSSASGGQRGEGANESESALRDDEEDEVDEDEDEDEDDDDEDEGLQPADVEDLGDPAR